MNFYNRITGQTVTPEPWQLELKVGDHYIIKQPKFWVGDEVGIAPTCYGEIITNTPEEDEPPYPNGFFLVRAFSQWCPEGELGMFCIIEATRQITKEKFEQARLQGWPTEDPNA
ncbi:MAG: hypothetical protein KDJ52_00125 [Anaerolineae bacterium]|nr:hypothetical protein [Anaerolineae bacterium]